MAYETTGAGETLAPFDVVALAASAGGIEAVSGILRALPPDLPAAVLVLQHLRQAPSELDQLLQRHSKLPLAWVSEGTSLSPGRVYVCPPQHRVEVHPDGTCSLERLRTAQHPIDATLESVAQSYRARAALVVLTGMRNDGAAGAIMIKKHGGTVLAQSADSAEQPSMPRAAIATGAVDMVFPLSEIPRALIALVVKGALPRSGAQLAAIDALFGSEGLVRPQLRRMDWAATSLGPVDAWSSALLSAVRMVLDVALPAGVFWGPEQVFIYNDAAAELMAELHPTALGKPGAAIWGETWPTLRAIFERIERTGQAVRHDDELWLINRHGYSEEMYFKLSFSPVWEGAERVCGVLAIAAENTEHVVGKRRSELVAALASTPAVEAHGGLVESLSSDPHDLPFALVYEVHPTKLRASLIARAGVSQEAFMASPVLDFTGARAIWPVDTVAASKAPLVVSDLRSRFGDTVPGPWAVPPQEALLLPLCASPDDGALGVLVAGISPVRRLDAGYRAFLEQVAKQVAANLALTNARSEGKLRARAIDDAARMKAEFFSNVSHEFRTPLTLAIAPLERLLSRASELPAGAAAELELAHRNARRLLTLVNQLLDFTRSEAGRLEPSFELVDLAAETERVVELFRAAIERAGIQLAVDCARLSAPVRVDPGMWERVVSNLLANAVKFTFEGEIRVELRERVQHAELVVRDTGVGIPEAELPNLFERFHRVRGARARNYEGSGIGLALTRQLIRLHGGQVRVKSIEGRGAAFTVWIPMYPDRAASPPAPVERELSAASALAETALSWIENRPIEAPLAGELSEDEPFLTRTAASRVLVADDSADMRAYLERLLQQAGWRVRTAADGASALEELASFRPDLVLIDVMMPGTDGLELLRRIRSNAPLESMPVIVVTGCAGEAAAVEGLVSGADDHVTKPFTARELVARVGAQLELARVRNRNAKRDAYRVKLAGALRGLSDPVQIQSEVCRTLAHELGVTRVYYAELEAHGAYARIDRDFAVEPPSIAGRYRVDSYGAATAQALATGQPLIVTNVERDARFEDCRELWRAVSTIALVCMPIAKKGETLAVLCANHNEPRAWTDEEVQLVHETAERTWEAVVRARVESEKTLALRRSELLRELSEQIAPEAAMQALYDAILRTAIELAGAGAGSVQLLDTDTRELVVLATSGSWPEMEGGDGSALLIPLVTRGGEQVGMVTVHWAERSEPDDELLWFTGLLARQAADLIERARIRGQLRAEQAENARLRALLGSER